MELAVKHNYFFRVVLSRAHPWPNKGRRPSARSPHRAPYQNVERCDSTAQLQPCAPFPPPRRPATMPFQNGRRRKCPSQTHPICLLAFPTYLYSLPYPGPEVLGSLIFWLPSLHAQVPPPTRIPAQPPRKHQHSMPPDSQPVPTISERSPTLCPPIPFRPCSSRSSKLN
jgi:hypothetical protein